MTFSERYGPWAIIAGASEGTGACFARLLAEKGVNCILVSRRQAPLEALSNEMRALGVECVTASVDLSKEDAFERIKDAAGDREIGLYISNAGSDHNASYFHERAMPAWLDLVNFNVTTALKACHHFGGAMRERGRGGLLLVGSGACYSGGPYMAIYSGSKAFLMKFSEGLWAELEPCGVDVLYLVLKQTDTPAEHRHYERLNLPMIGEFDKAEDVAAEGLARLAHGPVHNVKLDDRDPGYAGVSASAIRDRVRFVAKATETVFRGRSGQ
jgi:short-subunit dehydrogenase